MKIIIASIFLALSIQANALPVAKQVYKTEPIKVVTTPGADKGLVNLAAAFEFSNHCVMGVSDIVSELTVVEKSPLVINQITALTLYDDNLLCTAEYDPVTRWMIIGQDLALGSQVSINGSSPIELQSPEPAICIKSMCNDGKPRDSYTCACTNGLTQ